MTGSLYRQRHSGMSASAGVLRVKRSFLANQASRLRRQRTPSTRAAEVRYDAPILKIFVPQTGQVPWVAGRPFFIVICFGSLISREALHFTQYPLATGHLQRAAALVHARAGIASALAGRMGIVLQTHRTPLLGRGHVVRKGGVGKLP